MRREQEWSDIYIGEGGAQEERKGDRDAREEGGARRSSKNLLRLSSLLCPSTNDHSSPLQADERAGGRV